MIYASCTEGIALKVTQDQRQELANFYIQIEQRAYRMAWLETRSASDALDMVQDAMESLMKRYAQHSAEQWRPLFYTILQNRIKDWHRWSGLRKRLHVSQSQDEDGGDPVEQIAARQLDVDERAEQDIIMNKLQGELERLSLRQRQTVLLRIWEGFSVKETAQIMKCSQGSVKTHLSRALGTLKIQLEQGT